MIREYIKQRSAEKISNYEFDHINITYYNCNLPTGLLFAVLKKIKKLLPKRLYESINGIYVGAFQNNEGAEKTGWSKDGVIFVYYDSSIQISEVEKTIIHELSHCLERDFGQYLVEDSVVQDEFKEKRISLYEDLYEAGMKINRDRFQEITYNKDFDNLISVNIGFDKIRPYTDKYFVSPYSCISINEYVACSFEEYLSDNRNTLKSKCPLVYTKLGEFFHNHRYYRV